MLRFFGTKGSVRAPGRELNSPVRYSFFSSVVAYSCEQHLERMLAWK